MKQNQTRGETFCAQTPVVVCVEDLIFVPSCPEASAQDQFLLKIRQGVHPWRVNGRCRQSLVRNVLLMISTTPKCPQCRKMGVGAKLAEIGQFLLIGFTLIELEAYWLNIKIFNVKSIKEKNRVRKRPASSKTGKNAIHFLKASAVCFLGSGSFHFFSRYKSLRATCSSIHAERNLLQCCQKLLALN